QSQSQYYPPNTGSRCLFKRSGAVMRLTPDKGQSVFLNNRSIPLQTKLLSWLEVDPKDRLNVGEYNMISDT
ncbi:MAG: hypothetical protein RMX57_03535, partial [Planktomarina sp.]|nr:hypothetical protein [Planktomarina sp.]